MLYEKLNADMKSAMINKDKETLSTLRYLKSAIDLYKINNKIEEVTDEIVIDIASKQVKTHKESILQFEKGNRLDLAENLKSEIKLLETFLPKQLSDEEVEVELNKIFEEVKPSSKADMGKIMREVNSKLKGKVDMKKVSELVNNKINSL